MKLCLLIRFFISSRVAYERKSTDGRKHSVRQLGFYATSYLYTRLHSARGDRGILRKSQEIPVPRRQARHTSGKKPKGPAA